MLLKLKEKKPQQQQKNPQSFWQHLFVQEIFLKLSLRKGYAETRFELKSLFHISCVHLILKFCFNIHFSVFSGLNLIF